MKMRFAKLIPAAVLALGMALLGPANSARAGFEVKITDVTLGVTHTYNAPVISGGGTNSLVINDIVGNFAVFFEIVQNDVPGTPSLAMLTQSGNSISNLNLGGSEQIKIEVTATDYTSPTSPPLVNLGSSLSGTIPGVGAITNVTFDSYIGTTNGMYEQSIANTTVGPLNMTGPSGALSGRESVLVNLVASPYSLTNILQATFSNGAVATNLSGTTSITATPEPASIAMALTGIPMLALAYRRRRAAKA